MSMTIPKNKYYTLKRADDSAEITLYGEIVETVPIDPWTEKPVDGQYIVGAEFLADLESVKGAKTLVLRMNSCGGDAVTSIMIHNRLRELSRAGTAITCIVDGVAMSGGSLIMCAADLVQVNPSSLIMIHKCWSFMLGAYNADELLKAAETNAAYDKAQVAIYAEKTGMKESELLAMMAETTYMTGAEAVEKDFADWLLEDAEPVQIAASADRSKLYVHGRTLQLPARLPDEINVAVTGSQPAANITPEGEGGQKMANNVEELRAGTTEPAAPMTEADSVAAAVQAERNRMRAIDEISALYPDELVNAAKYGDKPMTAQELAYQAALQQAKTGASILSGMEEDASQTAQVSGAQNTETANTGADDDVVGYIKATMQKINKEG